MRIAYIAAGAAGMYCGSCIHDNTLAAALQKQGHDVALIPTYTPIRTDEQDVSLDRVFYGGLNVYLQEKISFFRKTPWKFDRLFNSPRLLKWMSKLSSSTNARDLGGLIVSVLKGEEGHQRKELAKLVDWLKNDYKPDIVHLTNSMFLGFCRELKKHLGVPVLCSVQGEDLFLEDLIEPYKTEARKLIQERAKDVDGIIATSKYYADFMSKYLSVNNDKMHVVRLGINLDGHGNGRFIPRSDDFVIGYLARICPEKGLHHLVEAFHILTKKLPSVPLKLRVAGYLGKKDEPYLQKIQDSIKKSNLNDRFDYVGEIDRETKIDFLNSLDLFSVPTVYKESKGLFLLEAMANSVPVVQPRHGTFPEVIEITGGGILVEPGSPERLAQGIQNLYEDEKSREQLGNAGKQAIHNNFGDDVMAKATLDVYKKYLS